MSNGKSTRRARRLRHLLIQLQRSKCAYCFRPLVGDKESGMMPTLDHVWPRALGHHSLGNRVVACRRCNQRKDDAPPTGCQLISLEWVNAMLRARGISTQDHPNDRTARQQGEGAPL